MITTHYRRRVLEPLAQLGPERQAEVLARMDEARRLGLHHKCKRLAQEHGAAQQPRTKNHIAYHELVYRGLTVRWYHTDNVTVHAVAQVGQAIDFSRLQSKNGVLTLPTSSWGDVDTEQCVFESRQDGDEIWAFVPGDWVEVILAATDEEMDREAQGRTEEEFTRRFGLP